MKPYIQRQAADLAAYPNLVVIYLGMRVYSLRWLTTLLKLGNEVRKAVNANPDGLLFHESFYFSLLPLHMGLRQYCRQHLLRRMRSKKQFLCGGSVSVTDNDRRFDVS